MNEIKPRKAQYLLISFFIMLMLNSCIKVDDGSIVKLDVNYEKIAEIEMCDLPIMDALDFVQPQGENYILFLDRSTKRLSKLDLERFSLTHLCTLQIDSIQGWFYDAQRSECYVDYLSESIIRFNDKGEVIGKYAFPELKTGFFEINSMRNFRPVVKDNTVCFYHCPRVEENYKNPRFFQIPIEGVINLKDSSLAFANQIYPSNYQQNCYGCNFCIDRMELSKTKHAYAFSYNDSVFIYDFQTKETKRIFFGSRAEKTFKYISYNDIAKSNDEVFESIMQNPTYIYSGFAPLSKIKYRRMLQFDSKSDTIKINNSCTKKKSFLVLYDQDFNYLGETEPGFDSGMIVDSKRGLLKMNFNKNKIVLSKISW